MTHPYLPTGYLHGASADAHLYAATHAARAVRAALAALAEMTPHRRDYQGREQAFRAADAEHDRRLSALEGVLRGLEADAEHHAQHAHSLR